MLKQSGLWRDDKRWRVDTLYILLTTSGCDGKNIDVTEKFRVVGEKFRGVRGTARVVVTLLFVVTP